MTKNLDNTGLRSIVNDYDLFYIDIWGVIHNGVKLHKEAIEAINSSDSMISIPKSLVSKNSLQIFDIWEIQ